MQESFGEIISGTVKNVIYQNDDTGYTVLRLDSEEYGDITMVGILPRCSAGELLEAEGQWMNHPQHGRQFKADEIQRAMPATEQAVFQYLSSGVIKGVGPVMASRIIEQFGFSALEIMEKQPERLAEISGITPKRALEIGAEFRQVAGIRKVMDYLASNGIAPNVALKLYKSYGDDAVTVIASNPYVMVNNYYGVSFEQVDAMAIDMGVSGDDNVRVEAGVIFELRHNLNNGHCFLPADKLAEATSSMLNVDTELCTRAIESLDGRGEIVCQKIAGYDACYLYEYFEAEEYVAQRLKAMANATYNFKGNVDSLIDRTEREQGIIYAEKQRQAVLHSAQRQLLLLTGGPGTGKTTSVKGILSIFSMLSLDAVLAAPTGRAAKRLSELTGEEATTIHRLLEAGFDKESGEMCFKKNERNMLNADAVVVDECSMVDIMLMRSLLAAMKPGCRLVLVGDANQLPSVGAGNVFADAVASNAVTTVRLTEIFRQAMESDIVVNAHMINKGELPRLDKNDRDFFFMRRRDGISAAETIVQLCSYRLPQKMGISSEQIQVLTPMRKGSVGTMNLNLMLQAALNPPSADKKEKKIRDFVFREGDRVMQIKNNYDIIWKKCGESDNKPVLGETSGAGVYNGDIGVIVKIGDVITVRFDDRIVEYGDDMLNELELAYAMTVHKSQGSEYRAVVMAARDVPGMLCARGVLYTAVTRAKELFIIVGDEETVAHMTANYKRQRRFSGLRIRLNGQI